MFVAKGEVIKFDGFLKVYLESTDEENGENGNGGMLPDISKDQKISFDEITATQRYTRPPSRYLKQVWSKNLKAWYWKTFNLRSNISTIQKRGYVHKEEREGTE